MNKLIEQELNKCAVAIIPKYNNELVLNIPKGTKSVTEIQFELHRFYQIELENILLNPPDNFIFHIQWNNNILPTDKVMNVEVTEIMGKMIKVNGSGVTSFSVWNGWLPKDLVRIISLL